MPNDYSVLIVHHLLEVDLLEVDVPVLLDYLVSLRELEPIPQLLARLPLYVLLCFRARLVE